METVLSSLDQVISEGEQKPEKVLNLCELCSRVAA
jgi:hypothetical protein